MNNMNRLLTLILALVAITAGAASPQMLTKGLDLTGQSTVTASQLNQMVDNATLHTPYGIVIRTNGRPTLTAFSGHTNFLWYDISVSPPALRGYVCCGDADTNWVTATIGADSIASANLQTASVTIGKIAANGVTTSNLNDNAVTDVKITAGAVVNSKIANGAVSNANIAASTITGDRISTLTITDTNIAAATITEGKLAAPLSTSKIAAGTAPSFLVTTTGGAVAWTNWITAYSTNGLSVSASAGTTTNAHPLGAVPTLSRLVLVCVTPELSYNASDEVDATSAVGGSGLPSFAVVFDASNFYLIQGGSPQIRTRTNTYAHVAITPANWRLKLNSYKLTTLP